MINLRTGLLYKNSWSGINTGSISITIGKVVLETELSKSSQNNLHISWQQLKGNTFKMGKNGQLIVKHTGNIWIEILNLLLSHRKSSYIIQSCVKSKHYKTVVALFWFWKLLRWEQIQGRAEAVGYTHTQTLGVTLKTP